MNIRLLFLLIALAAVSCNSNGPTQQPGTHADSNITKNTELGTERRDTIANKQIGNEIKLAFDKDSSTLTTSGHIDSINATIICYLPVKQGKHLSATVQPVKGNGNVRFNQLWLPDGSSDGPFGKKLEYDLHGSGLYQLYIGASKMAENPYIGNFTLTVTVKYPKGFY